MLSVSNDLFVVDRRRRDRVRRRFDVGGVAASQRRQNGLGCFDRPVRRPDNLLERLVPDVRSLLRRLLRRIRRRR